MANEFEELKEKELGTITGGEYPSSKTVVPDVIGKMYEDAKSEIENLGLKVDSEYENSSKRENTVLSSKPLPGIKVESGSKVVLTLSNGRE